LQINAVADLNNFFNQNDDASHKIADNVLQTEAQSDTDCAANHGKTSRTEAQIAQPNNQTYYPGQYGSMRTNRD